MQEPILKLEGFSKHFLLHEQNKIIPSSHGVNLEAYAGRLTALVGPTGAGKSSILNGIYRSYLPSSGKIMYRAIDGQCIDLAQADEHQMLDLRRSEIAFVTQFLRFLPRQGTEDVVAQPLYRQGVSYDAAIKQAREILAAMNIPERLWSVSPATFSGGEKQRVNLARGLIAKPRLLLLDEPTASLDPKTTDTVVELITDLKAQGSAMVAIFHDPSLVERMADDVVSLTPPVAIAKKHGDPMNSNQTHLTHARIILPDAVLDDASLIIGNGIITAINPECCENAVEIDMAGKTIMPGMIDLHCDALEKEVEPRPGIHFPMNFAVAQADKRNAAAGVTTVFHAMAFANNELGIRSNDMAAQLVQAVHDWQPHALVDNRVHCRYEITDESGMPVLQDLLERKQMDLLSLMDHTPGQGQFKSIAAYRDYLRRTYRRSESEMDDIINQKEAAAKGAFARVKNLIQLANINGIIVASHDDDCTERVDTMEALEVQISEFPITLETARYARKKGMRTVMGAPNILRGKSQSDSMRAIDGIHADVVDCLCADYAPAALIVAVFHIPDVSDLSLPDAVRFVTANPAQAAGLNDRGEIMIGKRADLIAVDFPGGLPQVSSVWVDGVLACQNNYDHG